MAHAPIDRHHRSVWRAGLSHRLRMTRGCCCLSLLSDLLALDLCPCAYGLHCQRYVSDPFCASS